MESRKYILDLNGVIGIDVELLVRDYEFAEAFSRAMSKLLNKKNMEPYWSRTYKRWMVYYRSKAFYQWYRGQTLDTLE